tara:strand:+ start:103557 stop:104864 length:1308 start_codon:yes stop_codon:yes gene_type:complete
MERRKFVKNVGLAAAGSIVVPYILPSGRLFAKTGSRQAKHVVYVMFGGGLRNQESVQQRYLADSQNEFHSDNLDIEGNIMPNMFEGAAPDAKIVYGEGQKGEIIQPPLLSTPLAKQGLLFPETRSFTSSHYAGFVSLLQGNTLATQGLRQKPLHPTIFEYLRRHAGEPASKVWFIGHSINNSTPLMNHSLHADYGIEYGANFFAPPTTFGDAGINTYESSKIYHPEEEMPHIYKMKHFLDNYYQNVGRKLGELGNTEEEKHQIKTFMKDLYKNRQGSSVLDASIRVLREFKPTLLAFSIFGVDTCHGDFTGYLRALHNADRTLARIWQEIQSIPEMKDNTVLIVSPEHGRNLKPNPIRDQNDWYGYDHSDDNAKRVWSLMAGPGIPQGMTIGGEGDTRGTTNDCVPTIAEILGIKNEVMGSGLLHSQSRSFLDQI